MSALPFLPFLCSKKTIERLRQTANANLYHVTKFPHYLSFTVHYYWAACAAQS